jgi:hypothetical protein
LKKAIVALAFLSSVVSFLVVGGGGGALVAISNSGEQATGALLGFCGTIALVCVMVLIFASEVRFREPTWRAGAIAAAIIGAMPSAGIAAAAFRFAGLPIQSAMPAVDWSVFVAGILFTLGSIAILVLGYLRSQTPMEPAADEDGEIEETDVIQMRQLRDATDQLRAALEDTGAVEEDDGIRVRRV